VIDIIDNAFVAPNGDRNDDIEITINSGDSWKYPFRDAEHARHLRASVRLPPGHHA
jgi:hypothetical protein